MAREPKPSRFGWKFWVTVLCWCAVFVSTAVAARHVHQFVITDPQFTLSPDRRDALLIEGVRYASRWKIRRVFAGDFGRSIFAFSPAERRRRLLAVDWVEQASVSRIWPNQVVVRITERVPVAFVTLRGPVTRAARAMLIDRQGVLLEPPPRSHFAFPVLAGITEQETESERARKVRRMLEVTDELGTLASGVSEVRVAGEDVTIWAKVRGRLIELQLGNGNFAHRFQNFLDHYAEIQKRSENVNTFDLRLDDRITARE